MSLGTDLVVPPEVAADPKAQNFINGWKMGDGTTLFNIAPLDGWGDPAIWGIALADLMKLLVTAYHDNNPDKSKTLIRNRILELMNAELDGRKANLIPTKFNGPPTKQ